MQAINESSRKFWPFRTQSSIGWSIAMLVGFLFVLNALKKYGEWQISERSDTAILIGMVLVSLLPVLLAVLDVIIERGGVVEYGGVRIDFSQVPRTGVAGFAVPTNIGVPDQAVNSSSTPAILDALRHAIARETVVIDLGEGQAWWETRLLVLLAGAVRLGRPDKLVFIGNKGGVDGAFQGWGYSVKLLPYLLKAHPQYLRSYLAAQAAARQWELVEPLNPPDPANPTAAPPKPPSIQTGLAAMHAWMAFDGATGLPNPLLAEQLLASDLGQKLESQERPRTISLVRLQELFQSVLYETAIDTSRSTERQMTEFFDSDVDYLAITQKAKYMSLASRLSVLNALVKSVVSRR